MGTAKNFVIQRTTAHKEIEGNRQWIIGVDCYVCSRWKYSLFVAPHKPPAKISGTFETLHHGPCTSAEMLDIRQFARRLVEVSGVEEEDRANYVALLPEEVRATLESDQQAMLALQKRLTAKDLTLYQEHGLWLKAIAERLPAKSYQCLPQWPSTFSFDKYSSTLAADQDPELSIFADYVRPTPHVERYKFTTEEGAKDGEHGNRICEEYFVAEVRKEALPLYRIVEASGGKEQRRFEKSTSVFKAWNKDSPAILRQALKTDFGYWKAAKVVKDPEDFRQCELVIQKHFEQLKHIFVNLISGDNYPHIGWNEFGAFCRQVGILDGTTPTATVDRMFIATKVGAPNEGSGNTLFRHEFLEIMMRISNVKYRETGQAATHHAALSMMLESIIHRFATRPWQEFRDASLWTVEVDQVLKTNADPLRKVYDRLFPKYAGSERDGLKACLELMTRTPGLQLSEKEARFCFGMSKMTVRDEVSNHAEYHRLRYPEFLEFLGRAAHAKYVDDASASEPAAGLEALLDLILPVYSLSRKATPKELPDAASSEDSAAGDAIFADHAHLSASGSIQDAGNAGLLY